ncbi:hypothetical protein [Falsibacillus pallidus]|uniref:hypothetical protein n=1 Tax=Falsibacillus pallidus TaxID=493781 RepID=UPI003D999088
MATVKSISVICSLILIMAIGGFGLYEWITKDVIKVSTIFFLFLGIGFLFNSLTWGDREGKRAGKKDELEKHITLVSSKISYDILLGLMVIVLIVSERVTSINDIRNIPLVMVIGLAFITLPITEFVISKKYR